MEKKELMERLRKIMDLYEVKKEPESSFNMLCDLYIDLEDEFGVY